MSARSGYVQLQFDTAVRAELEALVPNAKVHDDLADVEAAIYADVIDAIENSEVYS